MEKEPFEKTPQGIEQRISDLIREMQEKYSTYYDDLDPADQTTWNELSRFANIEKDQDEKKRIVLEESLISFLDFLQSTYGTKE
ncbi:MAG: hypothetical protein A3B07_03260 [Candidatus Yonathbacteria bacterium RIFCSPLOWO2_01_FULL_43_27]|uniref:Uncharacterized protein n=2 Tax=Parcubacteria group TaxID=1794811 RepID=A0A1G2SCY8_9BACT|nr:MAG: hypothetical protein UW78_C0006G0075 [Candidatus Azambacteria bacterium GW2011_GWA1_44_9]OHA78804.1 MAG: hypothetical protein A2658_00215 [Candidatus Yonathbacteria bacterium RIFCSPHIGHO2_01_FULL_44_19]OHA82880.1 MAG: hypothetical protein A3B07_03260 [Candidatus Yonathbacteria bacterium RIFCSPLOWO2_01_FULL_43_27]